MVVKHWKTAVCKTVDAGSSPAHSPKESTKITGNRRNQIRNIGSNPMYFPNKKRSSSSTGRAPAYQAGGCEFEARLLHYNVKRK